MMRDRQINKALVYDAEIEGSKQAILDYNLLKKSDKHSLLEINLLTGRHHQIRAQLAHVGHSIVNDFKYGSKGDKSQNLRSICLHSRSVEFTHPMTKETIKVEAPLPKDFVEI